MNNPSEASTRRAIGRPILLLSLMIIAIALAACSTKQRNKALEDATATPYTTSSPQATSTRIAEATSLSPSSPTASPTPTPVAATADVIQSGFATYKNSLGDTTVTWAAVVQNKSSDESVEDVEVTALFYDAADVLLKSDAQDIVAIRPKQASAAGSAYVTVSSEPARMTVRVTHGDFVAGASTSNFTVADAALKVGTYSTTVQAKVTNPFDKDIKNLEIVCVVTNAAGTYLGVGTSFLDLLPAATTAVASCDLDDRLNVGGGSPALYVSVANITSIPD